MVRVFLKGGVWKNSEDEILKAAVQKYGKQQWARVASLLNRKTAKQCKARWQEWLDPAIRKTEWSRAEEENLLHLVKLMPAQWKTIAPLVGGRTATQCQEHYEYLLDQAAAATAAASSGAAGAEGEGNDADSDLRKFSALRAGQIDSHPETKPARPDPVDMDEDELEMLQEARARLANTVGKKAKRKQREKVLAAAKRLGDLQKRRELKQAGLLSSNLNTAVRNKSRNRREMDLAREIPFHKPAPAGFHDTTTEDERAEAMRQKRLKQVNFHAVNEQQYRTRDREAAALQKREEQRIKILQMSNDKYQQQYVKSVESAASATTRPRGALQLPEPTITEVELSQVAKLKNQQAVYDTMLTEAGAANTATQALLGDYSHRPLPTPMRTPSVGTTTTKTQADLLREASHLRQLERGQTPLLTAGMEIDSSTAEPDGMLDDEDDRKMAAAATPRLPDRAGAGRTPGGSVAASAAMTVRDQYGLNSYRDDGASVGAFSSSTSKFTSVRELARLERLAAKRARQELEAALAALPAPQFEYELDVPTVSTTEDEEEDIVAIGEADRADVEAAERERWRQEAEKLYEARNSVVKRSDLPRPLQVPKVPTQLDEETRAESVAMAELLIRDEMMTLLQHDAHEYPVPLSATVMEEAGSKKKKSKKRKKDSTDDAPEPVVHTPEVPPRIDLEILPEEALNAAKAAIEDELLNLVDENAALLKNENIAHSHGDAMDLLVHGNIEVSKMGAANMVYLKSVGWTEASSDQDILASLKYEFETLQEATAALQKNNDKAEAKLTVMTGGYRQRADKFRHTILQCYADFQNARIEESVYNLLQSHERQGAANRIEKLQTDIAQLKRHEATLQKKYADLLLEKRRLTVIQQHSTQG